MVSCFEVFSELAHRLGRLPAEKVGMVVDKGHDFPKDIEEKLIEYGRDMWLFREQPDRGTTRAINSYRCEVRG
jgi:hypothetical protein